MSEADPQLQGSGPYGTEPSKPPLDNQRRDTLIRGLFIILFAIIYSIAEVVIAAVVVLQFGFVLIAGEKNDKLLDFGAQVSTFIYQVLRYVSFNADERPFPFSDWPEVPSSEPPR